MKDEQCTPYEAARHFIANHTGLNGMKLHVSVSNMHYSDSVCIDIPDLIEQVFEPVDLNSDPMVFGGVCEAEYRVVMATRKDAADVLSIELSKLILDRMSIRDTTNGYERDVSYNYQPPIRSND